MKTKMATQEKVQDGGFMFLSIAPHAWSLIAPFRRHRHTYTTGMVQQITKQPMHPRNPISGNAAGGSNWGYFDILHIILSYAGVLLSGVITFELSAIRVVVRYY